MRGREIEGVERKRNGETEEGIEGERGREREREGERRMEKQIMTNY